MDKQNLNQKISDLFALDANRFRFGDEKYDLPQSEIEKILSALSPSQLDVVLRQSQKWRSRNGDKFNCLIMKGKSVYEIRFQKRGYYWTPEKTSPEINSEKKIA